MIKKIILALSLLPTLCFALTLDDFNSGNLEVVSNDAGVLAAGTAQASGTIGGLRHQLTIKNSGLLNVSLEIASGLLLHSQRANVGGASHIVWNADSTSNTTRTGLSGINILQDILDVEATDGFIVDIYSYDFANGTPTDLNLTVFSSDNQVSTLTRTLTTNINNSTEILFAFNDFTPAGTEGPANFKNVTAITLSITGTGTDTDLAIDSIRTTGCTQSIPTLTSNPIDRCEVCNGDGTSCCQSFSVSKTQRAMDNGVKKLERVIKKMLRKLRKETKGDVATRSFIKDTIKRVHQNQIEGWQLSWMPESVGEMCTGTRFCSNSSNLFFLDEYRKRTQAMIDDAVIVKEKLDALTKGETKRTRRFETKTLKIHNKNLALADTMPSHISTC